MSTEVLSTWFIVPHMDAALQLEDLERDGIPYVNGLTLFHGIKKDRHIGGAIKTAGDTLRLLNLPEHVGLSKSVDSGIPSWMPRSITISHTTLIGTDYLRDTVL